MGVGKPRCQAITASGTRCRRIALEGQGHCYSHSSARARERRENAAEGGKARARRPPDELETAKKQIATVTAAVLRGEVDRGTGAVTLQGMNTLLRAIEIQRRLDGQAALEDRLLRLEDELERRRGGSWPTTSKRG